MSTAAIPAQIDDPVNTAILKVSEDQITGFVRDPFGLVAERANVERAVVLERICAMMQAGTIRRVRQTFMANKLAPGALVAWEVSADRLNDAFEFMAQSDPFSGHVVIRTTDAATPGSTYKLWTTLKVPQGYGMEQYAESLRRRIGADHYRLMPPKKLFALGVGHMRRREIAPGEKLDELGRVIDTDIVPLSDRDWQVLNAVKREFTPDEIRDKLWAARADEAGVPLDEFYAVAESFNDRKLTGRFTTVLEHVKPTAGGQRVTRFNALFHWAVPAGRELEAGQQLGRFPIMTHAYWREGGPEFRNVNIMGVVHGLEKDVVLAHKAAIDAHFVDCGIPVSYTNVFWGGRSEITPSEVSPDAFRAWCTHNGLDPDTLRA